MTEMETPNISRRSGAGSSRTDLEKEFPFILWCSSLVSLAMLIPATLAASQQDWAAARAFSQCSALGIAFTTLLMLSIRRKPSPNPAKSALLSLVGAYFLIPCLAAIPLFETLGNTSFTNAWLEMVSAMTTTGAPVFAAERLSEPLHLWRAMIGWMGGFLSWLAAAAILAPLSLGGFEITARSKAASNLGQDQSAKSYNSALSFRIRRTARLLFPIWTGLTALCFILLSMAGESGFVALCHSMAILSTSGISPLGDFSNAEAGRMGEFILFLFLLLAFSRTSFSPEASKTRFIKLWHDPELRLALLICAVATAFLMLRHLLGAFTLENAGGFQEIAKTLWGTIFTLVSFLSTTGFESSDWHGGSEWSGLSTPGILLMALVILGGGAATTAGGIKLLRIYALYRHGIGEIQTMAHPSSVNRINLYDSRISIEGVYLAWLFLMIFALSIALLMLAFSFFGFGFEASAILAISALTTTGPLIETALSQPAPLANFEFPVKLILGIGMILGRLEALALLALFNPALWWR